MSDDSDYEYEDLADETYEPSEPTSTTKPAKSGAAYQLTNVLPLPRATTYSTQALYDQIHAGDIDLEPEYQRDVVWPEAKQIGLVDSIFRNFYVPPIIFVAHQDEDGAETKTCIDGKQRLTSLHRFMDGLIPHRDPTTSTKYWYKLNTTTQGARDQLLPERYQRLFANKQIVCVEYQDLGDTDEREIFQRVQLGMALTPAEKLQVANTPMSVFVRKLQSEYFDSRSPLDNVEVFEWDRSRGGDFRCITQALYIIAKYPSGTSIGVISQLEKWLRNPTTKPARGKGKKKDDDAGEDLANDSAFIERIHVTFQTFSTLVREDALRLLFLKPEWRVSPIEFVMMCLLISIKKDALALPALAAKLGELRLRVRQEHVDIRMNSRVAKTMFDFVRECSDTARVPETVKTGLKRKREEEDVVISPRKEKGRKEEELASPAFAPSQVSSVPPPPRPDRLAALREAKAMAMAPPKVPISTPASLR